MTAQAGGVARSRFGQKLGDQRHRSPAGMPLGQWVEQELKKALAEGLEAGVSIQEIEARLRQVVADAVQPMQQALARLEAMATVPSPPPDASSSVRLLRERLRQRRGR